MSKNDQVILSLLVIMFCITGSILYSVIIGKQKLTKESQGALVYTVDVLDNKYDGGFEVIKPIFNKIMKNLNVVSLDITELNLELGNRDASMKNFTKIFGKYLI